MRVLVTGANGFVGTAMCARLSSGGVDIVAAMRRDAVNAPHSPSRVVIGDLHNTTIWDAALRGVSDVVHLAGRVHIMDDEAAKALEQFRTANVDATITFARCAAAAGVKRFVFVSSVKIHGEQRDIPYSESDAAAPQDPYSQSKWEAEEALRALERETGMAVVIVRPPLVYGPGVRANFLKLMEAIRKGFPLPVGGIRNLRSLIFVGNLVDALAACLTHPSAAGRTFLVSDGEDLSTGELIRRLGNAMGVRTRLVPVPQALLRAAGRLTGRTRDVDRLIGSLTVDSGAIRQQLSWMPPFSVDDGLAATAAHYWETHAR